MTRSGVVSYLRVHLCDSTRQAALDIMQGQPLPPPDQLNVLADDTMTTISSSAKYIPETTVILPEIKLTWALFKASRLVYCFVYLDCSFFDNNLVLYAAILKCNPFPVLSVKAMHAFKPQLDKHHSLRYQYSRYWFV